jgi:hypothetical protein
VTYLIHADGALPNLALMKLASYFGIACEPVRLVRGQNRKTLWDAPGPVYGSSIFTFTDRAAYEREWGPIIWGGTGVSVTSTLYDVDPGIAWDALPPDYSIYQDEDRSIGFTQRGCRLKCSFCVVPKKEGKPYSTSSIHSIWRQGKAPKKILLLDNDFFGGPEWRDRVEEMVDGGFRVCLTQGINIRKVGPEEAHALSRIQYRDAHFQTRTLYTAWDNLGDEGAFKAGVAELERAGIPAKHLRVYMLIGYAKGETMEQILYRFSEMVAMGCEPYPMAYDRTRPELRAFQRWAIRGLYRAVPWDQYRDKRKAAA